MWSRSHMLPAGGTQDISHPKPLGIVYLIAATFRLAPINSSRPVPNSSNPAGVPPFQTLCGRIGGKEGTSRKTDRLLAPTLKEEIPLVLSCLCGGQKKRTTEKKITPPSVRSCPTARNPRAFVGNMQCARRRHTMATAVFPGILGWRTLAGALLACLVAEGFRATHVPSTTWEGELLQSHDSLARARNLNCSNDMEERRGSRQRFLEDHAVSIGLGLATGLSHDPQPGNALFGERTQYDSGAVAGWFVRYFYTQQDVVGADLRRAKACNRTQAHMCIALSRSRVCLGAHHAVTYAMRIYIPRATADSFGIVGSPRWC